MKKTDVQTVVQGAITNCGIGTAVINGIILWFTLPKADLIGNGSLVFNFLGLAIGCGVICPLFGGIILKGIQGKHADLYLGSKDAHAVARFVPDNLLAAALLIGAMTALVLWALPWLVLSLLQVQLQLARMSWLVLIALYSGACASFAAYFGVLRSHYAKAKRV